MYVLYLDESGTPDVPGNTSHFVLVGLSIPVWHWRDADRELNQILARYGLDGKEIHTAWIARRYLEQSRIPNFDRLPRENRRTEARRARNQKLLDLQKNGKRSTYRQAKKNFKKSDDYIHLTESERNQLLVDIAEMVAGWGFARVFSEAIDKIYFDEQRTGRTISEQAFEQVISRFERYLSNIHNPQLGQRHYGLLVHDNNETVARKHTEMMRSFYRDGTRWTGIQRIIETPLFVDSALTGMVQMADLCSFSIRRYLENGETELFSRVMARADRIGNDLVGVRHFTDHSCSCEICAKRV